MTASTPLPHARRDDAPPADAALEPQDDLPVTVIEARTGWRSLDLRDVWRSRELLMFLTWRDITIRYRQTVFGAAWAVLQPVATMLVFSVVFGRFVGLGRDVPGGLPYSVFVFAGLLPWQLFSKALLSSGNSVVANGHIFTKIYFPRLIFPLATVGVAVVDFVVSLGVLFAMMAWYGIAPGPQILLLPVFTALVALAALAFGMWLASLSVKYRDFQHVVPFLTSIWMYLTPVIWPVTVVPERFRDWLALNPMVGLTEAFRWCLLGQPLDARAFWVGTALSVALAAGGLYYFRRTESTFADVV